jgi:hypothetical protein
VIRHVFVWRVADGYDNDKVLALLDRLSSSSEFTIASWSMGKHVGEPNENGDPWHGALITDFRTWEDLEQYSTAPFHMEVVEELLPMVSDRAVVDFELADAA